MDQQKSSHKITASLFFEVACLNTIAMLKYTQIVIDSHLRTLKVSDSRKLTSNSLLARQRQASPSHCSAKGIRCMRKGIWAQNVKVLTMIASLQATASFPPNWPEERHKADSRQMHTKRCTGKRIQNSVCKRLCPRRQRASLPNGFAVCNDIGTHQIGTHTEM
jgi:hypothetical protein